MIRLFVADIDGTLLNEYSKLEEETIAAIRRFQSSGGTFMVATGRNSWELNVVTDKVDDVIINCVNGALLCEENGESILAQFVDEDAIRIVYELCQRCVVPVEFHGEKATYIPYKKEDLLKKALPVFERSFKEDPVYVFEQIFGKRACFETPIEEILQKRITKIEVLFIEKEKQERLLKEVETSLPECSIVSVEFMSNIEITSRHANKAKAIQAYCALKGIKEDEAAVAGDGENDIPMLKCFKHSYAMANANEKTRNAAKHVAASNREKGVAKLLNEICDANEKGL